MVRVLVVDDEASITTTLSLILQKAGCDVQTANSGPAALRISESFVPDVLITDFAMPDMTGLELAGQLNQRYPACQVVVFTGCSQISEPADGPVPKYKLLFKPVSPEEFIHLVEAQQHGEAAAPLRALRALCVDDVESHRYSIARFLRLAGFEVTEASTGSMTLRLALGQPDIIVLDIGLPDIDGIEVCRQLKSKVETSVIPVIHLTSSHLDEATRDESRRSGAYEYITAPFDPDYLLERARSAVQVNYLRHPVSGAPG